MKRFLIAAGLLLWSAIGALAQQPPNGSLWNGQASGGPQWTATPLIAGTLTISPSTGAPPSQALLINGTSSGGSGASFFYNQINVTNAYVNTGTTLDSNYMLPTTGGLFLNFQTAATNGQTIPTALVALAHGTGNTPNLVGGELIATTNAGSGNASALWGGIGYSNVGPSGNVLVTFGFEAESGAATGANILYRFGSGASSYGPTQATNIDSAFVVMQTALPPQTGWVTSAPFKNVLTLFDGYVGGSPLAPMDATGSIITAGGVGSGTFTIANVISLPNVTVAGNLFNLKNFLVSGAGVGTITGPSGGNIWIATTATGGSASLAASANGIHGFDGLQVSDVSSNNALFAGVWEASNTDTWFGQTRGNFGGLITSGSTNVGMLLGTSTAEPVIIGTNNTARLNISSAGAFSFTGTGISVGSPTGGAEGSGTINAAGAYYENGAQGLSQTCTVNQAKTLIFTGGILTGGTCNT